MTTAIHHCMSERDMLISYDLAKVADIHIAPGPKFSISITDQAAVRLERCIYAFVVGGRIQRIGSSKDRLRKRLKDWERSVTGRWQLPNGKSGTPKWEADEWRKCLEEAGYGEVFARQGSVVSTPIGAFHAYMDEESILIGRHLPPLNRSKHR